MKDIFSVHGLNLKVKCFLKVFVGSLYFDVSLVYRSLLFWIACRSNLVFLLIFRWASPRTTWPIVFSSPQIFLFHEKVLLFILCKLTSHNKFVFNVQFTTICQDVGASFYFSNPPKVEIGLECRVIWGKCVITELLVLDRGERGIASLLQILNYNR